MIAQAVSLETIEAFLAQKRIAMIGISRERKSISVALFEELSRCGYDIVPVNPKLSSINGLRFFARVQDIDPPLSAALIMTSPEVTESVVADCPSLT